MPNPEINISVIVPVYNGSNWLIEAVDSVLSQDVDKFEVVILDDGSSDMSWALIEGFVDQRCVCLSHPNIGLAATLNRGIALAKGRYVAREDQDDIVLPGRLRRQYEFLENNPDVAMVGTWAQIYEGKNPSERFHRHPSSNEALQFALLFDNPFVHASMMIRTDVLRNLGGYSEDKERQPPEDYELWSRIARHHKVANLPEVLTIYREFPSSMSRADGPNPFTVRVIRIAAENLQHVLPKYTFEECLALASIYHRQCLNSMLLKISRKKAVQMLSEAAMRISGKPDAWSAEFRGVYVQALKHINRAFAAKSLPNFFLKLVRSIKRFIINRVAK